MMLVLLQEHKTNLVKVVGLIDYAYWNPSPACLHFGSSKCSSCPTLSSQMSNTFTVRFWSEHLESPEYIGPFYSQDEAEDYADDRNSSLALSGVPSSVACYSVVD